ncbi:MAG: hypothetical protein LC667_20375 [Thioalkalivibrio sp.]|nr:hypothetical protein [Thioalkalivibrio sp.]
MLLWQSATEDRRALFHPQPVEGEGELVAYATREAPELADSLRLLWSVHHYAVVVDTAAIADACTRIALWAERREMKLTAVQFAELAARVRPDSSPYSFTAGRLCRRNGEHQRAAIWYRRAQRLGRLANNLIDIANAQLGLGNLSSDLGNIATAEQHFLRAARAALRNGRRSLAAAAFHNLIGVTYDAGRKEEAVEHLRKAAAYYSVDHPRLDAEESQTLCTSSRRGRARFKSGSAGLSLPPPHWNSLDSAATR